MGAKIFSRWRFDHNAGSLPGTAAFPLRHRQSWGFLGWHGRLYGRFSARIRKTLVRTYSVTNCLFATYYVWRREPELNRCTGFCRPLPNHSAIAPLLQARRLRRAALDMRAKASGSRRLLGFHRSFRLHGFLLLTLNPGITAPSLNSRL